MFFSILPAHLLLCVTVDAVLCYHFTAALGSKLTNVVCLQTSCGPTQPPDLLSIGSVLHLVPRLTSGIIPPRTNTYSLCDA